MAHIAVTDRKGKVECIFSIPDIYHYKGFYFEYHSYLGPTRLKKNGEIAARQGLRFYKVVDEWSELNKEEREATRW